MAYRVELTDRALRDLSIIYGRIGAESSEQAARWFDRLEKAIFSLEKSPNRALLTPEDPTGDIFSMAESRTSTGSSFKSMIKLLPSTFYIYAGQDATG